MRSLLGGALFLFAGLKAAENISARYNHEHQSEPKLAVSLKRAIAASLARPEG